MDRFAYPMEDQDKVCTRRHQRRVELLLALLLIILLGIFALVVLMIFTTRRVHVVSHIPPYRPLVGHPDEQIPKVQEDFEICLPSGEVDHSRPYTPIVPSSSTSNSATNSQSNALSSQMSNSSTRGAAGNSERSKYTTHSSFGHYGVSDDRSSIDAYHSSGYEDEYDLTDSLAVSYGTSRSRPTSSLREGSSNYSFPERRMFADDLSLGVGSQDLHESNGEDEYWSGQTASDYITYFPSSWETLDQSLID